MPRTPRAEPETRPHPRESEDTRKNCPVLAADTHSNSRYLLGHSVSPSSRVATRAPYSLDGTSVTRLHPLVVPAQSNGPRREKQKPFRRDRQAQTGGEQTGRYRRSRPKQQRVGMPRPRPPPPSPSPTHPHPPQKPPPPTAGAKGGGRRPGRARQSPPTRQANQSTPTRHGPRMPRDRVPLRSDRPETRRLRAQAWSVLAAPGTAPSVPRRACRQ